MDWILPTWYNPSLRIRRGIKILARTFASLAKLCVCGVFERRRANELSPGNDITPEFSPGRNNGPEKTEQGFLEDDPLSMVRRSMLYACGLTYEEIQRPQWPWSTPTTKCTRATFT